MTRNRKTAWILIGAGLCFMAGSLMMSAPLWKDRQEKTLPPHETAADIPVDKDPDWQQMETHVPSSENVHDVQIRCDVGDIRIVFGDSLEADINVPLAYAAAEDLSTEETWDSQPWDQAAGTEEITESYSLTLKNIHSNSSLTSFPVDIPQITVTVPKTVRSVNITSAMGNVELSRTDLESLDLDLSMGSAHLSGAAVETLNAALNMGDFSMENCRIEKNAEIRLNMGEASLTLAGQNQNTKYDLSTSLGEVTVNGEDKGTRWQYAFGSAEGEMSYLYVQCSMGDITLHM